VHATPLLAALYCTVLYCTRTEVLKRPAQELPPLLLLHPYIRQVSLSFSFLTDPYLPHSTLLPPHSSLLPPPPSSLSISLDVVPDAVFFTILYLVDVVI